MGLKSSTILVKKILENDRLKRPMTINKNRHITRHIIVKCQKLVTGEISYRLLKIFFKFISNQKSFGFLKSNTGSKTNNEAKPLKLWKKNTCKVEQTINQQLSMFRHSWFQKMYFPYIFSPGKDLVVHEHKGPSVSMKTLYVVQETDCSKMSSPRAPQPIYWIFDPKQNAWGTIAQILFVLESVKFLYSSTVSWNS